MNTNTSINANDKHKKNGQQTGRNTSRTSNLQNDQQRPTSSRKALGSDLRFYGDKLNDKYKKNGQQIGRNTSTTSNLQNQKPTSSIKAVGSNLRSFGDKLNDKYKKNI